MAEAKKIFKNKTKITQIVYDEDGNKVLVVPGGTVEGVASHYLVKFGAVLKEVKPEPKKEASKKEESKSSK